MSNVKRGGALAAMLVAFVGAKEGYRPNAYLDAGGVPTICFGETKGVHIGDRKTRPECEAMFITRLDEFATHVESCITRPMPVKVEVAFVSLAYNIGWGGFCKSPIVALYNAGKSREACDAIHNRYVTQRGVGVLRGLVTRRNEESRICLDGLKEAA
jgi:lysozyme